MSWMRRIRRRKGWFLFLLLAGIGAVWVGREVLAFRRGSSAPVFRIRCSTRLRGAPHCWRSSGQPWTRNDSADAAVAGLYSSAWRQVSCWSPQWAGGFLSTCTSPAVRFIVRPGSATRPDPPARYRESGKLQAAEEAARDCLADDPLSPRWKRIASSNAPQELVWVLYREDRSPLIACLGTGPGAGLRREPPTCLEEALEALQPVMGSGKT
jgi:hypothetical protein